MSEQHEAGRALDALVAQRVFGYETDMVQTRPPLGGVGFIDWHYRKPGSQAWKGHRVPRYSTDASAAMLVVEKIHDLTDMTWNPFAEPGTEWAVRFSRAAYAPTLPLAICRAALAAVGESDG